MAAQLDSEIGVKSKVSADAFASAGAESLKEAIDDVTSDEPQDIEGHIASIKKQVEALEVSMEQT